MLVLLLACLPAWLAAQEVAGTFKSLRGQIVIERARAQRPARLGEPLFPRDRVITRADGYAGVGLRDQSALAIGPNSDVDLSRYSFQPTTHRGEQQVRVRAGSLASISGKLAKASPEAVRFNAGSVTLGVRGTQLVLEAQPEADVGRVTVWRDAQQQLVRSGEGLCWQSGTAPGAGAGPGGCPGDRFVLLPDRDGQVGALTVSSPVSNLTVTLTVTRPYTGAQTEGGVLRGAEFSEREINARYQGLLATLPPSARTFVVRFVSGSSDQLAPGSREVLEEVRQVIARWPVVPNVDVIGHTDSTGRGESNDALSLARAQAVSRWLDVAGLPPDRLQVSGRGERQLLVATPDETPEAQNRRVEITVY